MRAKPHDDTRRIVESEKGRTTGAKHSLSVSPAQSTRLPRKTRGNRVALDMSKEQVAALPDDALVALDGNGNAKLAIYSRPPEPRKEQREPEEMTAPKLTQIPRR